ncbi:MAG: hypothetical protein JJV99_01875 [Colwellia sp.]|nr:hypothetical protein [Colwellia sp.]
MSISKITLLLSCLILSACQTTGIRELSANDPNYAKLSQKQNNNAEFKNYPTVQTDQLRMYVFTEFEDTNEKQQERDGYFIDFEITTNKEQKQKQKMRNNSVKH